MSKVKYQGLYFKWGSTVGIAPTSTALVMDPETGMIPAKFITYTNGQTGEAPSTNVWSSIPYDNTSITTPTTDICTLINSAYRTPTKKDMETLIADIITSSHVGTWTEISSPSTTVNADGTYSIPDGNLVKNVFLPASGSASGPSVYAGSEVSYWSSTTVDSGTDRAYSFYDWNSNLGAMAVNGGSFKDIAFPIRCIKKPKD
jgi:hypothetical protein